jgi:hypothetical protein
MSSVEDAELSEFIRRTIEGVKGGVQGTGYGLPGNLHFDLSVTHIQGRDGKSKIFVASGGGKYEKETVSKLKFDLNPTVTSERDRDGRHYV